MRAYSDARRNATPTLDRTQPSKSVVTTINLEHSDETSIVLRVSRTGSTNNLAVRRKPPAKLPSRAASLCAEHLAAARNTSLYSTVDSVRAYRAKYPHSHMN